MIRSSVEADSFAISASPCLHIGSQVRSSDIANLLAHPAGSYAPNIVARPRHVS